MPEPLSAREEAMLDAFEAIVRRARSTGDWPDHDDLEEVIEEIDAHAAGTLSAFAPERFRRLVNGGHHV